MLLTEIFTALNKNGIRYVILRSYEGLPEVPPGDDIDLLVSHADTLKVHNTMRQLGFFIVPDIFPHVFAYYFEKSSGIFLKFDIIDRLAFGHHLIVPFPFFYAQEVLERRIPCQDFFIPSPADELLLLCLHGTIDKLSFKPAYQEKILVLIKSAALDKACLTTLLDKVFGSSAGKTLFSHILRGDFQSLLAMHRRLKMSLLKKITLSGVTTILKILRQKASRRILGRKGLRIALLGPDGSGKSTLARLIAEKRIFNTTFVYMGRDQFVIPTRRLVKYFRGLLRGGPAGDPKPRKPSQLETLIPVQGRWRDILDVFRLVHDLADFYLRYFLSDFLPCRKGFLVINDRYIYDMLSGGEKIQRLRLVQWLIMELFPAPDLVFILEAPAQTMFARKGEHSVAELNAMKQNFAELHQELGNSHLIQTDKGPDESANQIISQIWKKYFLNLARR